MLQGIYQLSDLNIFIGLAFIFIIMSVPVIFIVRRYVPIELRYRDNPVIGNISALISIIYGVLVGLMALYLINNISYTADAVQREANAVADIYRDTRLLKDPQRSQIQTTLKNYLERVINVEWTTMKNGLALDAVGRTTIESITDELVTYPAHSTAESLLLHDMLDGVKTLYDAREQRIHMSHAQLNSQIWLVILIGTFLIIIINYIYGINFYLHILTVSAVALMAASVIFLLLTLDRPFQGEFGIQPSAFQSVLSFIEIYEKN
ncbi:MAG: DUF4239 domain-containing protein [Gammaproteobacteria bacterium]|nr:DUF4239 domain-containing protein [Gammaproteobacteria bacterium]